MRLRTEWILVPCACLLMAWLLSVIDPAWQWANIVDTLNVRHEDEYKKLTVLGLALVALVAILRVLRGNDADK